MKSRTISTAVITSLAALSFALTADAAVTVLTVPWVPASPTTPHTTFPVNSTTEKTIVLGATVPSAVGSADSFTFSWSFGDGTSSASQALTNPYDISITHQYPASAATGTQWTATVTVTDTTTNATGSAKYYVIQEPNVLSSRVNVAIDWGLWYMHQTMWRGTATIGSNTVPQGGWDTSCTPVNGQTFDCLGYGSINAENVQAFEVNGHLQNGPASDPYTDDVARGIVRALSFLAAQGNSSNTYTYDPSKASFTCADGSIPQTTDLGACTGHGGQHNYNPSAASCTTPPCMYTFDANSDSTMIYSNDGSGEYTYTTAPFLDMLVAAGTPNAVAVTTTPAINGLTYQTIIQDILDFYAYSQYGGDCDVSTGYYRGYAGSCAGGGWLYGPQQGDDNSTSQWAAIAFISGQRGAGISIPPIVTDANNVWMTNAQDVTDPKPTASDPYALGDNFGGYGYRGSLAYSNPWGPFATTPSGGVQMAMDGIGRTTNTTFGDGSTTFDQRWNSYETFYADNFCNAISNGPTGAPRAYIYGMFSFTKGMLLHNPGGVLSPIQYLRTLTPNVFTGNSSVPANTIDWYAATSAAEGGTDPCDGVAQTLVNYQDTPASGVMDGHWWGNDYYGSQFYYETAWSLIMLKRTVFITCINNLAGQGSTSGSAPARIDLSWSNQANSTSYDVLRSTTAGGPYTQIGTTTTTSYSDTSGLVNGGTYYYVVQPVNGDQVVCQSNQATVTVPKLSGRH